MDSLMEGQGMSRCVFNLTPEEDSDNDTVHLLIEEGREKSISDDDEGENERIKRLRSMKTWSLYRMRDMKKMKAVGLEVPEGSKAYVCAKNWVVVFAFGTWDLFLVNLVSGVPIGLPVLNPKTYRDLPPHKDADSFDLLSLTMEDYFYREEELACCACDYDPSSENSKNFVAKFVLNVEDKILVAMINPLVCHAVGCCYTLAERILAYYKLDGHYRQWTPFYVYPSRWLDGVFHKSKFVVLTDPPPYYLRIFSFDGVFDERRLPIRCVGRVELNRYFMLDEVQRLGPSVVWQFASIDDKLYLVGCNSVWSMSKYYTLEDFDPPDEAVKMYVLSYSDSDSVAKMERVRKVDGNKAVFVGDISAFAIDVKKGDAGGYVRPNRVYFTPQTNYDYSRWAGRAPFCECHIGTKKSKALPFPYSDYPKGTVPMFV